MRQINDAKIAWLDYLLVKMEILIYQGGELLNYTLIPNCRHSLNLTCQAHKSGD